MNNNKPFNLGIVEGFFGQAWSWQARVDYIEFLSRYGFSSYLYAPKSDEYLRKQWHVAFPERHFERLQHLSQQYSNANLDFGIGLSPFELYRDFSKAKQEQLRTKIKQINSINPTTLCILFDDMQGDFENLATKQNHIMEFVLEHSHAKNFILCPTYYSDDPILLKYFGEKPDYYLEELGKQINPCVDIFWTGPEVISSEIPIAHIEEIAERLQRPPLIWDNYPVNDSQKLSDFLHLSPFANRDQKLANVCSGHISNPMNQAYLSQIALHSLSQIYNKSSTDTEQALHHSLAAVCQKDLAQLLINDLSIFQEAGLSSLDAIKKQKLIRQYSNFKKNPMAKEIVDWLKGLYIFDPDCLT